MRKAGLRVSKPRIIGENPCESVGDFFSLNSNPDTNLPLIADITPGSPAGTADGM